jgi:hypothetical protein
VAVDCSLQQLGHAPQEDMKKVVSEIYNDKIFHLPNFDYLTMRNLEKKEMQLVLASGGLAGIGLGAAGLTYFGLITVATGGTVGLVVALAGVGVGIYCSSPIIESSDPGQLTRWDIQGLSFQNWLTLGLAWVTLKGQSKTKVFFTNFRTITDLITWKIRSIFKKMKYLKNNIGPIVIFILMLFMSYRDFQLNGSSKEKMYVVYLIVAFILLLFLIGIYCKYYLKTRK